MSDYGFFWNSRGGDRLYDADSMEEWLNPFFSNGTFGGDLMVTATGGMGISVAAGYVHINGKVMRFAEPQIFTLAVAGAAANRVDTVVVERNDTDRTFYLKVITGVDGAGATTPVRTGGVYQIVVAQIAVAAGATAIAQTDITDTRSDTTLCGIVTSTSFDELAAEFNSWFDHFRSNITGDAAGQLQGEIELLDEGKENAGGWVSRTIASSGWVQDGDTYYYSFESVYPSSAYNIVDVVPNGSTTSAMRNAWILADCGGYEETNIIRCHGKVPTIDIVIGVCVRQKGAIL